MCSCLRFIILNIYNLVYSFFGASDFFAFDNNWTMAPYTFYWLIDLFIYSPLLFDCSYGHPKLNSLSLINALNSLTLVLFLSFNVSNLYNCTCQQSHSIINHNFFCQSECLNPRRWTCSGLFQFASTGRRWVNICESEWIRYLWCFMPKWHRNLTATKKGRLVVTFFILSSWTL